MSDMPLETCRAYDERWNNKFCCKVTSCWLFLLSHTEEYNVVTWLSKVPVLCSASGQVERQLIKDVSKNRIFSNLRIYQFRNNMSMSAKRAQYPSRPKFLTQTYFSAHARKGYFSGKYVACVA
jgi:hypothetical protein